MNAEILKSGHAGSPHASLAVSIAAAESISSAASLGAVWFVGHNPQMIAPTKKFLTEHIIYPVMKSYSDSASSQNDSGDLLKKAEQKASLLLKGAIMVGSSFVAHVPTQMFLEGKYDLKELKKVVAGKSVGLAMAMASLAFIDYIKPGAIGKIEDGIGDSLFHCHEAKSPEHCEADKELCKLMVIDIPSSAIAGLVNYQFAKRLFR